MEEKTIKRAYGNPITLDIASHTKIQEEIQQEASIRLSTGRYTLNEAALYIEERSNSNARSIFNKLKESALTDKLSVYRSGSDELYKHKHNEQITNVFVASLEAYWNDLNAWLKMHEPRLECEFPEPIPISNEGNALSTVKSGITKNAVIYAFAGLHFNETQWRNALGKNIPKWLEGCRVIPGKKGSKTSATWNPVLIASALYGPEGKDIPINKLDAVFVRLPYWIKEWQEASESFRY